MQVGIISKGYFIFVGTFVSQLLLIEADFSRQMLSFVVLGKEDKQRKATNRLNASQF